MSAFESDEAMDNFMSNNFGHLSEAGSEISQAYMPFEDLFHLIRAHLVADPPTDPNEDDYIKGYFLSEDWETAYFMEAARNCGDLDPDKEEGLETKVREMIIAEQLDIVKDLTNYFNRQWLHLTVEPIVSPEFAIRWVEIGTSSSAQAAEVEPLFKAALSKVIAATFVVEIAFDAII